MRHSSLPSCGCLFATRPAACDSSRQRPALAPCNSLSPLSHAHPRLSLSGFSVQGDIGCSGMVGVPRVQPLNDYRLLFMVKKGLDTYLKNNKVGGLVVLGQAAVLHCCIAAPAVPTAFFD